MRHRISAPKSNHTRPNRGDRRTEKLAVGATRTHAARPGASIGNLHSSPVRRSRPGRHSGASITENAWRSSEALRCPWKEENAQFPQFSTGPAARPRRSRRGCRGHDRAEHRTGHRRRRRRHRVQPPRGAADRGRPGRRQHRPLRVRQPRRPDYVTFVANWIPFEEPNGGPNFYPFATDAATTSTSTTTATPSRTSASGGPSRTIDKRGEQHVPLQQRPGHLARRREPAVPPDLHAGVVVRRRAVETRITDAPVAPSRVGQGVDAGLRQTLRDQAINDLPGGWKVFAGQADDPFFLDLRVFDLLYGGDLSEVGQDTLAGYNVNTIALQVPFKRRGAEAATPPATRSSACGAPPSATACGLAGKASPHGRPGAGVPPGQPAGQRGRRAGRPQGRVQRAHARQGRRRSPPSSPGSPTPSCRSSSRRSTACRRRRRPRNDLVEIFLTGITTRRGGADQGRPQLAAEQRRRRTPTGSSSPRRCCG